MFKLGTNVYGSEFKWSHKLIDSVLGDESDIEEEKNNLQELEDNFAKRDESRFAKSNNSKLYNYEVNIKEVQVHIFLPTILLCVQFFCGVLHFHVPKEMMHRFSHGSRDCILLPDYKVKEWS